jgi:predicted DCC family thiol-disulfide oxidoreductase YuxK
METQAQNFLIYDGDCGFCDKSVRVLKKLIGDRIEYLPSYKIEEGFYGIQRDSFNSSIKFFERITAREPSNSREEILHYEFKEVHKDAIVYHGAYAVLKALSYNSAFGFLLFFYEFLPGFSSIAEGVYAVIARNRQEISRMLGANECKIQ